MIQHDPPRLAVCADPPHHKPLQERAADLAAQLGIDKTRLGDPDCDLLLAVTDERLELRVLEAERDLVAGKAVPADLGAIDTTSPAGRRIDVPLLRAVGIKKGKPDRPSVIDCTAGLGEDAWLLASFGCEVKAIERQPAIAALLADAMRRAAATHAEIAERLTLIRGSALDWLASDQAHAAIQAADAIVLDPMFPTGRKTKERKPLRVMRLLAGDDADAPALLDAAMSTGVRRVCVKRPLRAPAIACATRTEPSVVYRGKAVRFDVYLNP